MTGRSLQRELNENSRVEQREGDWIDSRQELWSGEKKVGVVKPFFDYCWIGGEMGEIEHGSSCPTLHLLSPLEDVGYIKLPQLGKSLTRYVIVQPLQLPRA